MPRGGGEHVVVASRGEDLAVQTDEAELRVDNYAATVVRPSRLGTPG